MTETIAKILTHFVSNKSISPMSSTKAHLPSSSCASRLLHIRRAAMYLQLIAPKYTKLSPNKKSIKSSNIASFYALKFAISRTALY